MLGITKHCYRHGAPATRRQVRWNSALRLVDVHSFKQMLPPKHSHTARAADDRGTDRVHGVRFSEIELGLTVGGMEIKNRLFGLVILFSRTGILIFSLSPRVGTNGP